MTYDPAEDGRRSYGLAIAEIGKREGCLVLPDGRCAFCTGCCRRLEPPPERE